ncbi:MAG: hypothetical protein J7K40_11085 [candidate division Zixibacteria bacterium]|nr:hypothetical protein [candidate division Zixibacteria bacterium]
MYPVLLTISDSCPTNCPLRRAGIRETYVSTEISGLLKFQISWAGFKPIPIAQIDKLLYIIIKQNKKIDKLENRIGELENNIK